MALILRGFCGNAVENKSAHLWIKMWEIRQVIWGYNLPFYVFQWPEFEGC